MRVGMLSGLLALILMTGAATGAAAVPSSRNHNVSAMLTPLPGEIAPNFTLTDVNGYDYTLSDYTDAGNVVVLEWFDPSCPEVAKYRANTDFMDNTSNLFASDPVVWLAIDSSGPGRHGSSPGSINRFVRDTGMTAPVLLDSSGDVGRDFGVNATPTLLVISADREVIYRGAPDESAVFSNRPAGTNYIRAAVEAALDETFPVVTMTPAHGCLIPYTAIEPY